LAWRGEGGAILSPQCAGRSCGPSSLLLTDSESSFPRDKGVGLEATTHLHLAQKFGMSGDKSPLHHLL